MADFAAKHLAGALNIADLYSGWGPFALRLGGEGVHVAAYEGAPAMISALNHAAGQAGLGGFVKGHVRDLARRPLLTDELKGFEAVLLDPPRSGAAHQTAAIAAGGPGRIVYLSCNPFALARDGRVLMDAGYRFRIAQPIDQFRWTPHLEVATLFDRT
jgi:23S rRNA (uracil1939-C5)-methyltransferase